MIYFDSAATTFPKPPRVVSKTAECMARYCGNPGRSGHFFSEESAKAVYSCREEIASLFGGEPQNVVLTQNATHAINTAVNAFSSGSSRVLISDIEHNAVYRKAASTGRYDVFECDPYDGGRTLSNFRNALKKDTGIVVVAHASNVCGITLPIKEIGGLCRENGIRFIVDASQSAGKYDIDINECNIDCLCAPGHKGLYGPQGSGFCLFGGEVGAQTLRPTFYGGTGVNSRDSGMPDFLPERLEAGTLNTPAAVGLREGIRFVKEKTPRRIREHEERLARRCVERLGRNGAIRLYLPDLPSSCVLFNVNGVGCETVASRLAERGVCVRAGLHCSPLAHAKLGSDGAVRVSFSYFNTEKEGEAMGDAVDAIARLGV